jgi:hypothetical protein
MTSTFFIQPFASVSYWDAFQNNTSLNYTYVSGSNVKVTTQSPKEFWQVDGGVSFAETNYGVTGFVKGTHREGDNIEGNSIVLGARLNF